MAEPKATSAGRGVLYIAFAKFYFMIAGLIVQFRLPAILSHVAWGSYSFINAVVSPVNNVLVTGTIQTVSRFSAQQPDKARAVQQAGLRMHVRLGLPIAIAFVAAAPIVAWASFDSSKMAPLMLAGLIVGGNAFYATFIGTANGSREFHKQAGLDISFATVRTAGLIGMAMAGLGVLGVIAGWVAAVGIILVAATTWIGLPRNIAPADRLPVAPMVSYFIKVAIYLALFNALMFVDTWLIKRLTTEYFASHAAELSGALDRVVPWAGHASGYHVDTSAMADVQVGYYAAVQNLARLSYQAIIAATFVVFPLVSRSTFADDKDTTRRYIEVTTRYSLIFAMAIAVVMAANPEDVLGLVYAPDYAQLGGPALMLLALGNVAFSVFAIAGTILNGAGLTRPAIITAALTLVLAAVANYIAIPLAVDSGNVLQVAAGVTGGSMLVGAIATGIVLHRRLGAFLPITSIVRVGIATVVGIVVGRLLPFHGKLMTLVEAVIVGLTFLVVLVATRELGKRDLQAIKAVRNKRAGAGEQQP
ncbi:MAG TPA: oligosaccharide flippase family protein [Kofleriaceae bacterium]|jgi:stage V sporulation protein B|nr:oligosaccharide flippase family protein [Kofleriaceae bacterium]